MDYFKILTIILSITISAVVSLLVFNYKENQKDKLETQRKRRSVLDKYREFISVSAYQLQSRIYNILLQDLFSYDYDDRSYSNNVKHYTIYLVGQFFAWKEIFRKEMQYLDFRGGMEEIVILKNIEELERLFSSDDKNIGGKRFMIFRGDQRAIGECMTIFNKDTGYYECIGYSTFIELVNAKESNVWLNILTIHINNAIKEYHSTGSFSSNRLTLIQRKLIDLIDALDPGKNRFPKNREKIEKR